MTDPVPPPAPKRRGLFAFFFKTALGCAVFCVGLLLGTVLALPMLFGGSVRSGIEEHVRETYRGSLAIADLDLAWFAEQTIEGATLLDPDGKRVAQVSATLPSLWELVTSGGARFGTVRVVAEADLVADDAGVTNLARALAPRLEPPPVPTRPGRRAEEASGGKDLLEWLAELELDLAVSVRRLTWSDAETRGLGKPFELADLEIAAVARPGAPMTVKAGARVSGDAPGVFDVDARVNGPVQPGKEWPFGTIEARGNVRGFSSALADGLAGQRGRLAQVLGKTFDLTFSARDVTRERGEIALELGSEGSRVALSGRVEDGVLRAQGERFLDASIALPRAYLDAFVVPHLPPGSRLDFGAAPAPWTVRIDAFELPIPSGAKLDAAALRPVLERTTCKLFASFASPLGFDNAETQKAFGRPCALEGTTLAVELEPGQAPRVQLASTLVANRRSPLALELSSADAWAALAGGTVPHLDGKVALTDAPVAALDAVLGTEGRLAEGFGDTLRVAVELADAGVDRGRVTASVRAPRFEVEAPLVLHENSLRCAEGATLTARLDAPAGWIEGWIAVFVPRDMEVATEDGHVALRVANLILPLPGPAAAPGREEPAPLAFLRYKSRADVELELPSVRWSNAATRAVGSSARLLGCKVAVKLAHGDGAASIDVQGTLETGAPGEVKLHAELADVWAYLPPENATKPHPVTATLSVNGLAPAFLVALAEQSELDPLKEAFGGPLDTRVEVKGLDLVAGNGEIAFHLRAPRIESRFAGTLTKGILRGHQAPEGFELTLRPEPDFVQRTLAPYLSEHSKLAFAADGEPVRIEVRGIELELPDLNAPDEQRAPLASLLERSAAKLTVHVPAFDYADDHTRAARVDVGLDKLGLSATLEPKKPLEVALDATVVAGERSDLHATARIADPWAALRAPGGAEKPVDARVQITKLATRLLDAFVSEPAPGAQATPGVVSKLLGPTLDLDLQVTGATTTRGDLTLEARSPESELRFSGTLADGAIVATGDQGLELTLRLSQEWLDEALTPHLPAGARLALPAEAPPLALRVGKLRIPLPKSEPSSAAPPAPANEAPPGVGPGSAKALPAAAKVEDGLAATLDLVAGLALDAELVVPELVYTDAKTQAAGRPIAIKALKAEAKLAPDALPFVRLTGTVVDEPPGEIAADVRALDPLKLLAEDGGADRFRVACDVAARGVPTALVDLLAGQDGLLVDALGARVQATVKSPGLSMQAGTFTADLTSDLHSVHCEGAMQDGVLRITKQEGLAARVGLGPVVNERVVGRLVPMLVNLKKPEGATPALLAVDDMQFPLDGDLRGLDADVRIDLGEVTYALLPGLDEILGKVVELKPTKIPAFAVPIRKGVATYQRFQVPIAGQPVSFSGSFDLVDLTLKLDTEIPLKVLGKKASAELEKVREYLNPDLVVPVEIRGTWKKPKVSLRNDFVKKVVEDAAKQGLGDLLEGFLKKKKKD